MSTTATADPVVPLIEAAFDRTLRRFEADATPSAVSGRAGRQPALSAAQRLRFTRMKDKVMRKLQTSSRAGREARALKDMVSKAEAAAEAGTSGAKAVRTRTARELAAELAREVGATMGTAANAERPSPAADSAAADAAATEAAAEAAAAQAVGATALQELARCRALDGLAVDPTSAVSIAL